LQAVGRVRYIRIFMKLRIRGDSVRLRLRQAEVRELLATGFIEESTTFSPEATLRYRLETGGGLLRAVFESNRLCVTVPHAAAKRWASSEQVGISDDQPAGQERMLRILIEKDFACKEGNSLEPQEDAFENPAGSTSC
jgi:hypothetical protein